MATEMETPPMLAATTTTNKNDRPAALISVLTALLKTESSPRSPPPPSPVTADDIIDLEAETPTSTPGSPFTDPDSDSDDSIDPFIDEASLAFPGTPQPCILPVSSSPDYFPPSSASALRITTNDQTLSAPSVHPTPTEPDSTTCEPAPYVYEFGNDLDDPIQSQDLPIIHRCPHPWIYTPSATDASIPTLAFHPSPSQNPTETWVPIQDSRWGTRLPLYNHYAVNVVHPPMALDTVVGGNGVTVADILYWTVEVVGWEDDDEVDWEKGTCGPYRYENGGWVAEVGSIESQRDRGVFSILRAGQRRRRSCEEHEFEYECEDEETVRGANDEDDGITVSEAMVDEPVAAAPALVASTPPPVAAPTSDDDVRSRFHLDEDDEDLPDLGSW